MNWLKQNWFKACIILIGFFIAVALLSIAGNYQNNPNTSENTKSTTTRFYIKSEIANVRECQSTSCKVLVQYFKNSWFDFPLTTNYKTVSDMPDWVSVKWSNENGNSGDGWINKSNFSDTPIVVNQAEAQKNSSAKQSSPTTDQNSSPKQDLVSIIKQWRPAVVYIECEWKFTNSDGSIDYERSRTLSGSGLSAGNDNGRDGVAVYTNKHVITLGDYTRVSDPSIGMSPGKCLLQFPDNPNIYTIYNTQTDADSPFLISKTHDLGVIMVTNKNLNLVALSNLGAIRACNYKAPIGESVIILGYPGIGASNDITATEGIISGYDGDYYITDAKIEHGNSGGVAVSLKNNCTLGIPTYVKVGSIESLGRILDINKAINY